MPGRVWDTQRRAQGFRSQAHLDAFYRHWDHEQACGECGQPGPAVWLEGSASWQPTMGQCDTGRALFRASWSENFPAAAVMADQRGHDVAWMTAGERETLGRRAAGSAARLARYAHGDTGYRLLG